MNDPYATSDDLPDLNYLCQYYLPTLTTTTTTISNHDLLQPQSTSPNLSPPQLSSTTTPSYHYLQPPVFESDKDEWGLFEDTSISPYPGGLPWDSQLVDSTLFDPLKEQDQVTEDFYETFPYHQEREELEGILSNLEEMGLQEELGPIECDPEMKEEEEHKESLDELTNLPTSMLDKIKCKTRNRERGPKSWEFLMRLLADPRTNPSVIRWEEEGTFTFRLTRPDLIASLWSSRGCDKPNLCYNNFARGLRHHYTTGGLLPVMEKQLVYRCGPKAMMYLSQLRKQSQNHEEPSRVQDGAEATFQHQDQDNNNGSYLDFETEQQRMGSSSSSAIRRSKRRRKH